MSNKDNTKEQVAGGFLWKFGERISAQLVTFVVSLVLARLLTPEYYGAISLVTVFITFANVFVSGGFGNALIQKKDTDELDYSSVFYGSLAVSVVLYIIIFFFAPSFAVLYNMPELTPVFRVMGLRLLVAAVNSVQHAYVSKHMMFRKFFWSTLIGTVLSGVVGVGLAYANFGIWALVAQYMVNTTVDTIVLFITVPWRPRLLFSLKRLRGLFSYGWKLLVSELINTGYTEIRSLIVGIKYSSADLAYYNKGQSFPRLVVVNINASIQSVLFPVMAKAQDDVKAVRQMARRSIRIGSFIVVPMVLGLGLVAKPFVALLLTEKWLECVPYLQLYCVFYCLMPIQTANLQAIKAVGRSDIYLKMEVIKKALGIALLLIAVPFGTFAIAVSAVVSNVIAALMNIIPNHRLLQYTWKEQAADYFNAIIPLVAMSVVVTGLQILPITTLALFALQVLLGAATYILVSHVMKLESYNYVLGLAMKFLKRR